MKNLSTLILLFSSVLLANCTNSNQKKETMKSDSTQHEIKRETWGKLPSGEAVEIFTLRNKNGMEVKISSYGGIITHWTAPDRNGKYEDISLGYDSLSGYLKKSPYFGALVGRYGNRIAKGKFTLEGKTYQLAVNNGENSLHGGLKGFDKVIWKTEPLKDGRNGLQLIYVSKDGEEGYPGNLTTTVNYILTDDNALEIEYESFTDKTTVINITNHAYFNLSAFKSDVLGHEMILNCDKFLPVDKTLIPTGVKEVKGTLFDFTTAKPIGKDINDTKDEQIKNGGGYDHCWVATAQTGLKTIAKVYEPTSGRELTVETTEPAVQFYTGNFLDGSIVGKNGVVYGKRSGFCLETQHYPDSPNQSSFPSTVLKAGESYNSKTVYRFSTR